MMAHLLDELRRDMADCLRSAGGAVSGVSEEMARLLHRRWKPARPTSDDPAEAAGFRGCGENKSKS